MTALSLLRRLLQATLALWALVSLVFLLCHRDPTGPAELLLPDQTELSGSLAEQSAAHTAALGVIRARLELQLPVFYVGRAAGSSSGAWRWHGPANQYHHWLRALLHGDLGTSLRSGRPVAEQLGAALRCTLPLTAAALGLVVGAALLLGQQLAAPRRWWHVPVRAALVGVHSVPLFVVALGLLLLFANPDMLAWFPVYGLATEEDTMGWARLSNQVAHLVLPVASLVLVALPDLTLQLEAALRQERRMDYATTARAKGLGEAQVIRHHALPNALLPLLTQLTDLLPALVAGAVVVEVVYALPGMGRLLAEAAALRDYPVLIGGVLVTGAARLGALLLADVLYSWADPRIRWQN